MPDEELYSPPEVIASKAQMDAAAVCRTDIELDSF